MQDGGRNAARGLRYQYLRTLEALMDAAVDPAQGVTAVHVEGLPGPDGTAPESIDYEVTDTGGRIVLAAQVKARAPGAVMGAGEAFRVLADLVRGRDADRYVLLTSAAEGQSVRTLSETLASGADPARMRRLIGAVLASAGVRQDLLADVQDEHLARLNRAAIEFDPRGDGEISEGLRGRLRAYRNAARAGLGDESAGLLIGYLISEIFRRAADPTDATVEVSHFRSAALVDGAVLARALGRRDWGVVVGSVPRVPDVRREGLLERMRGALPAGHGAVPVPQCTLTGLSGIGKTSLAVGYLLERADLYDVIFWADAESEEALASSFSGIFRYLRGDDTPEPPDPARLREAVLTELSAAAGRWLLVLDNCADERQAYAWVPKAGDGHVIVTTLDSGRPPEGDTRIEVPGMPVAQAADLLSRRLSPGRIPDGPQLSQLARLARELDGWPLALELASAYLHRAGSGIEGIPGYLERLKLPSLGHRGSVPRGYPRTLIAAVDLCLERIRQSADGPEPDGDWAATVSVGILRIAAYLSSRRIPLYLVMSVPDIDPHAQGMMFRDMAPVVADHPDYPPEEAVGLLREYSLASPDERLPPYPGRDTSNGRYDSTITVNSVLQEIIRARDDGDPRTGLIIDRLAWHAERWLKVSFDAGAHERALILAAHAAAVEEHASRLNLATDSVAYLRGNLAAVESRQHNSDRVIRLLRMEIDHYRGRREEHARLLTCQASMQLAGALAGEDPRAFLDEIAVLLEEAYLYLTEMAFDHPEGAAHLLAPLRSLLSRLELNGIGNERTARLAIAGRDLSERLPSTPYSAAVGTVDEIEGLMHQARDGARAAAKARALLDSEMLTGDSQEIAQVRATARRLLIEALANEHDVQGALAELDRFVADAQPPTVFVFDIQEMLHNTGLCAGVYSLVDVPSAPELLSALLADGRADLVRARYPGEIADRIGLLVGVDALNRGDYSTAREHVEAFVQSQTGSSGTETRQQQGWRQFAEAAADAILAFEARDGRPSDPVFRLIGDFGRLQELAPEIQNMLVTCEAERLPLITALAIIHRELSGTPGQRSVPACWKLHSALGHLGFDGEVVAAAARVIPEGDNLPEEIGKPREKPSLQDDGSTNWHVVYWSESVRMLVDPAVILSDHVRDMARGNPLLSFPVMLPVPQGREHLFSADLISSSSRPSLTFRWSLIPSWTEALIPARGSALAARLEAEAIDLAQATLEIIRELGEVRADLGRMRTKFPVLADLLDGRGEISVSPG